MEQYKPSGTNVSTCNQLDKSTVKRKILSLKSKYKNVVETMTIRMDRIKVLKHLKSNKKVEAVLENEFEINFKG